MIMIIYVVLRKGIFADICLQITLSISNHVVDDISADRTIKIEGVTAANKANKANLKTNVLNLEIPLPCRESRRYISSELNKGKNEFCISIEINVNTGKIISATTGKKSEWETNTKDLYGYYPSIESLLRPTC